MAKATFRDIPTYYSSSRGKVEHDGLMYYGTFLTLEKVLTDDQKTDLQQKHENILFFMSRSQYAPEQKHNVIFLSDKNIKVKT